MNNAFRQILASTTIGALALSSTAHADSGPGFDIAPPTDQQTIQQITDSLVAGANACFKAFDRGETKTMIMPNGTPLKTSRVDNTFCDKEPASTADGQSQKQMCRFSLPALFTRDNWLISIYSTTDIDAETSIAFNAEASIADLYSSGDMGQTLLLKFAASGRDEKIVSAYDKIGNIGLIEQSIPALEKQTPYKAMEKVISTVAESCFDKSTDNNMAPNRTRFAINNAALTYFFG